MQKMTLKSTRQLDIFYNEHREKCTNCGKHFKDGDTAHLGYLKEKKQLCYVIDVRICLKRQLFDTIGVN